MPSMMSRRSVILAKIEGTEGVDASPAGTDAVLVENPVPSFNPNFAETNEVSGSLDGQGPIASGMTMSYGFRVALKGTGTAGVAPEWGKLMKACGIAETVTGTAVPAAPEALAAGGSAVLAVLGASAVGTAQLYRGMPIVFTGAVPGVSFISDYTASKNATLTDTMGGSLVATTNYQIPLNVRYQPGSTSIPSLTIYGHHDGSVFKMVGARGTVNLTFNTAGVAYAEFNFTGIFAGYVDTANPTPTYDVSRPVPYKNGKFLLDRIERAISAASFNYGNNVVSSENPNKLEGYDIGEIVSRNITGQADPLLTPVATQDLITKFRAGTPMVLHGRFGETAGNRLAFTAPKILQTNNNIGDRNGKLNVGIPFAATGPDAGLFLTVW